MNSVSVDDIDEKTLIVGFPEVGEPNHVGLIIAALIGRAALLMRGDNDFRIWVIPDWRLYFFLCAPALGIVLL